MGIYVRATSLYFVALGVCAPEQWSVGSGEFESLLDRDHPQRGVRPARTHRRRRGATVSVNLRR
jgi:hypothetical protein